MRFLIWSLLLMSVGCINGQWQPCVELKKDLQIPCKCTLSTERIKTIYMNCDNIIFTRENFEILKNQPITSITRRNVGYQKIPDDLLSIGLNIDKLDLSDNLIYRLMDNTLKYTPNLKELKLGNNLLGDNLNPIFSSNEFHDLEKLKLLDLHGNGIRSIEEGIFKGCFNLEELYLDDNNLSIVPADSLKGPKKMRILSLAGNNIGLLPRFAFGNLGESLLRVDLSRNELTHMEDNSLAGLNNLFFFNISRNELTRFNSDVFKGANNLLQLDLSINFLQEFPTEAFRHLERLKFLNLSNNLITEIERTHIAGLIELQVLDLSRNNIGRLGINAFANLSSLTRLDLSLNYLRTIEESSFEGLTNLKWLSLQDNNILLIPATAVNRLPSLTHLHVEFNRIAALSNDLLRSTSPTIVSLSLTRNLIREIPDNMFINFKKLINIELSGNMLSTINQKTFTNIDDKLLNLDISNNRITTIGQLNLKNLLSLNIGENLLKRITPDTFKNLIKLKYLNISNNPLQAFPPIFPSSLVTLDASSTNLKILPTILFINLESLVKLILSHNNIQEINEGTFKNLNNLTILDLSYNEIKKIHNGGFNGINNIYEIILKDNKLTSFSSDPFDDTTSQLEIIDLSNNLIDNLSTKTFIIHTKLREINLSNNKLLKFTNEYIKTLENIEIINLSNNLLKIIDEFTFSQIGKLRILDLSYNNIEAIDELSFHNSTQLQIINLSYNKIDNLNERTMEGILRLEYLNLSNNNLTSLPETIFDISRIRNIEKINLSFNKFNEIPIRSLTKQLLSLNYLNIANNKIVQVFTQDIIGSLKILDLSSNPLSENSINEIIGKAKILRSLNLHNTGIKKLPRFETPFLKILNLSDNELSNINTSVLERTTLLEYLDISNNKLENLTNLSTTYKLLPSLKYLDISGNDPMIINEYTFDGLDKLRYLKMSNLNTTKIEKNTFKSLNKLKLLSAYNYPRLGYFDVPKIIKEMPNLEILDIEIKDTNIGNDYLTIKLHPRLHDITLRGERLKNILSSILVGIRTNELNFSLKNSSIDSLPGSLFFPIPRSTHVSFDISGSNFSTITQQLLTSLDERNGMVKFEGLQTNPINCDCQLIYFWKWLRINNHENNIKCKYPEYLHDKYINELTEEMLTCDKEFNFKKLLSSTTTTTTSTSSGLTSSSSTESSIKSSSRSTILSEPEIIWTVAPTTINKNNKHYNDIPQIMTASSMTDDTLIIGIVGGVVAFIAIIIIVICICRLKWSTDINDTHMAAIAASGMHDPSMIRSASIYSGKIPHDVYGGSYPSSTLGHANQQNGHNIPVQMMPYIQPMHVLHSTPPQQIYYGENGPVPMYMCTQDDKFNR
ncbi:hypothetical protein HCN44_002826 [Aphidius gifuensis]|uniref:LRRCT domain-containing protein n=1 Tax=Aphidius gifuensis TaxID=684658 RepID=A0A835CQ14_APHGI|nr:protein artichoke [Aphidius gifuensis]KAF7991264.1 hypothetical protein HCN44_002826 [Aphidius gifuensis]